MKLMKLGTIGTTVIAAALALAPCAALACAMCGLSPGDHAGHAYNTSVLFMLAAPYVTFAAIGGIVFAAMRKAYRRGNGASASSAVKR